MMLVLVLIVPLLILLLVEIIMFKKKKLVDLYNGPPKLPIIGNAHQMGDTTDGILINLFKWWRESTDGNYRIWIGYFANIFISNVKDVEFITTSSELIDKSDIYDMLHPWLGQGLLTSHGTQWHKHRKMITPAFHFKILQNFHDIMNVNSTKFIQKLRDVSSGDNIFDFENETTYLTLDVICDTAMGVSINAIDNHDSEIVHVFRDICNSINMRAFHPFKRKNYLFRFAPEYPQYIKTLKTLEHFTNNVIEKRTLLLKDAKNVQESTLEDDSISRRKLAFLDTLLTSTIDNKPLTHQEVYDEVSTFIFEGHDTTTSGISFAIYLLSRHPCIQAKVYEEQQQIMGASMKRDATFQDISEMKYLEMFIKETLRLYPSVPFIGRQTDKNYNMNGKVLPKGVSVNLFIMALGYNGKTFPDPYRVDPERFNPENQKEKLNYFQYLPFSAGQRNCIGQKFAMLELKTVISKIVRHFEILPPMDDLISKDGYSEHFVGLPPEKQPHRRPDLEKYTPILSASLTLKSANGILIRLRERA